MKKLIIALCLFPVLVFASSTMEHVNGAATSTTVATTGTCGSGEVPRITSAAGDAVCSGTTIDGSGNVTMPGTLTVGSGGFGFSDYPQGSCTASPADHARVCADATGNLAKSDDGGTVTKLVGDTSPTIATPILTGKIDRNNVSVDDDDCTGEQGLYWYDTTDSAFEFCNANSGAPTVLGGAVAKYRVGSFWGGGAAGTTIYSIVSGVLSDSNAAANVAMALGDTLTGTNAYCKADKAPGAGTTYTIDLLVDGSATSPVIQLVISDTGTDATDTDSISITAGQRYAWKSLGSASSAANPAFSCSLELSY